tara:strand:- start:2079 stop:3011 length:933 start_codon:yes stop_codon:yes gene_type:complete
MENIKITTENLRFFLKVSVTKVNSLRKERATKLKNFLSQQKNKSKEKKLESSNNKFFNNINSIKRKSGGIFRNPAKFSESILEVVSLLLLGTAINNIDVIREKFKELRDKVTKEYEKVKKFIGTIVDATKSFISFFQTKFPNIFGTGESQISEQDLITLENDIKTIQELDNELQKIINKNNLDKSDTENSNVSESNIKENESNNISFTDSLKISDRFASNIGIEPNLLNLDTNAFSQTSDNNLLNNLSFNLDVNPKPKRSDFPKGRSGGSQYTKALAKWRNSQKSYFNLIPENFSTGDSIFVFRQPMIYK